MQFIPYLDFDGNCREAFAFYAQAFRGTIVAMMTYGESPMASQCEPGVLGNVMHACLDSGGGLLMGADGPMPSGERRGGVVNAQVTDPEDAERIFAALSEGGSVQMPLQETFWALRFGMLTDRFGKGWLVNCGKPMA